MDLPDPLSPLVSIVHCSRKVFQATSCIGTELARLCEGVLRSISLMGSSLLLQQCLVRVTWIVFVMGGRWPYSCWFVGCCLQDLFNTVFLRDYRQAFSPYVKLVSMWCIHISVSTRPLLGKNTAFYSIGQV